MPTEAQSSTLRFFHYIPNLPLAIIGLVVFILFAIYLSIRTYRSKCKRFVYILSVTALMEVIGFIARLASRNNTTMASYCVMTLFLLLSPNALALVNYKAAGEIIRLSDAKPKRFYLRPKFVTWFFFGSDFFAFFMQGSGGGLQASGDEHMSNIGRSITLFGLSVQLIFFACFALIIIHIYRNPKYDYTVENELNPKRTLSICLIITLVLLYIRSIYRIAEYADGFAGSIASAEWAFYVFDTLMIALSFLCYSIMFIGNYLPKPGSEMDLTATKLPTSTSSNASLTSIMESNGNKLENVKLYQFK
ncbi:MAG: RTA1 like protein-domain-containing protein [Benjaminiella poitrasii]|nr:MAG: RTA1 like protein-domain-containing protein [Benjaminiella poitrasii]